MSWSIEQTKLGHRQGDVLVALANGTTDRPEAIYSDVGKLHVLPYFWNSNTLSYDVSTGGSTPGANVNVTNFPTTQPVSGTFWQATQPVSGPLTNTELRAASVPITFADDHHIDAFGRLRVSNPTLIFESQFIYNLLPLLYEQIVLNTGATVTFDATNRHAVMTFASTPTGGKAFMQSYSYHRYQPGKSQLISMSFNFVEQVANCLKFVGYSDGTNGVEFQNTGATNRFIIYSGTTLGNQIANQADWNLDKLDGTGNSGITLDITKRQIVIIDFQALNSGRVRCGFDIGGRKVYCHEYNHTNQVTTSFVQSPTLPVRCGMTCTGTVSTTMHYNCCSVVSEGGQEMAQTGLEFAQDFLVTAVDGVRTHALSLRPKTTFSGVTNRHGISVIEVNLLVIGNSPVEWAVCFGQAITGNTAFIDVNTTYSSMEYNTLGTISGAAAITADEDYVPASNQSKGVSSMAITFRYPVTLDAAGAQRLMGTASLVVMGIGGNSVCRGAVKFVENRG